MDKRVEKYDWARVYDLARALVPLVLDAGRERKKRKNSFTSFIRLYGVPRGGIHVAQLIKTHHPHFFHLVETAEEADVIVDDLVDSGNTRAKCLESNPRAAFFTLIQNPKPEVWYSFPWERMRNESGPEENVRRTLQFIGERPDREGLLETPARVVKSYAELFSGYKADPSSILKCFEDGACDEMVVLRDIEFYSCCEHHMQPFFGRAHIGYVPNGKVVGISKLARLLEVYARRLQLQERLGQQITDAIMDQLGALGAGCILQAQHFCMTCRGVNKQNSVMVTSSLRGVFKDPAPRAEFLKMAGL